jgi:hypothetical protein
MTLETSLIDSALRNWRSTVDRAGKLFGDLSQEQLLQEVAPGKNRVIYLWGHLTAFNIWQETSQILWTGFSKLSVADWLQKHGAVSEEDFLREPHRNRFTILLARTAHIAYHLGQAKLSERVQT